MTQPRYACIHGHFYQPPRENPWLETIEPQDSAAPFHTWNDRIAAECYAPNAGARVLDAEGHVARRANNYASISFNFGATLLSWLEGHRPDAYHLILDADRNGQRRFSGHGPAIAQAYSHLIMPLASPRDQRTQVLWGIADFVHRFGRRPEGMWLPETAVDTPTLEALAAAGIRFTILKPAQALAVRSIDASAWRDVSGGAAALAMRRIGAVAWRDVSGGVDSSAPYLVRLPSGNTIAVFFYDGPTSGAVAFDRLLDSGERYAARIAGIFSDGARPAPQIAVVATDGESYGHHHRFGDMALAYTLHLLEERHNARLTVFGEYLELHPPTHEVRIAEGTAWSCAHGVGRWARDCGCSTGAHPAWRQSWRGPLRDALDWLRDRLAALYGRLAADLLRDPWAARDAYISVVLDRSAESRRRFFETHAAAPLTPLQATRALSLLEMQRHAILMYTSCGWFFDEISGIETVQVLQYAARAIQLAAALGGDDLQPEFRDRLCLAPSNIPRFGNGAGVFDALVRPAMLSLHDVAARCAVQSLYVEQPRQFAFGCYTIAVHAPRRWIQGKTTLVTGEFQVTHTLTLESQAFDFAALHRSGLRIACRIKGNVPQSARAALQAEAGAAFLSGDLTATDAVLQRHLGHEEHALASLFTGDQRLLLALLLGQRLDGPAAALDALRASPQTQRFLSCLGVLLPPRSPSPDPPPSGADSWASRSFAPAPGMTPDIATLTAALSVREATPVGSDGAGLGLILQRTLEDMLRGLITNAHNVTLLERIATLAQAIPSLSAPVDAQHAVDLYLDLHHAIYPEFRDRAEHGGEFARDWVRHFAAIGASLAAL